MKKLPGEKLQFDWNIAWFGGSLPILMAAGFHG